MATTSGKWVRRRPEATVLSRVMQSEWASVRALLDERERVLPRFCAQEVEAYLRCGILVHGFARVHCDECGKDDVLSHSSEYPEGEHDHRETAGAMPAPKPRRPRRIRPQASRNHVMAGMLSRIGRLARRCCAARPSATR